MAIDPRLDALAIATGDPRAPMLQEIADLKRRVAVLERTPTVQVVPGTPVNASRDGTLAVDANFPKLWVRRNGAWQYASLI